MFDTDIDAVVSALKVSKEKLNLKVLNLFEVA